MEFWAAFRGICENGEWIRGPVVKRHTGFWIETFSEEKMDYVLNFVHQETIGECTNMYDQNVKMMYKGDIVRLCGKIIGEIAFEAGAFGIRTKHQPIDYDCLASEIETITGCPNSPRFCCKDYFVSLHEIYSNYNGEDNIVPLVEIIGNKYDNPELLK